jgi:hypothetical protein
MTEGLGLRIIPGAISGTIGCVDRPLHVNHDHGGALEFGHPVCLLGCSRSGSRLYSFMSLGFSARMRTRWLQPALRIFRGDAVAWNACQEG